MQGPISKGSLSEKLACSDRTFSICAAAVLTDLTVMIQRAAGLANPLGGIIDGFLFRFHLLPLIKGLFLGFFLRI